MHKPGFLQTEEREGRRVNGGGLSLGAHSELMAGGLRSPWAAQGSSEHGALILRAIIHRYTDV